MGWILFAVWLVGEVVFVVLGWLKKSGLTRVRSIFYLCAAAGFGLLVWIGVIEWSFRYALLGALLLVLTVNAAVNLLRGRPAAPRSRRRLILGGMARSLLFFIVCLPAILFPQHQNIPPTGDHPVARFEAVFSDASRVDPYAESGEKRSLRVEFWYPQDGDGAYPLILFSHGSLGVRTSNETLYAELASHGYVVAAPDHTYQGFFTTDSDGRVVMIDQGYVNELMKEDARKDPQNSAILYQKWMGIRVADLELVLDQIRLKQTDPQSEVVYRLVDLERVGMIGHSLGGSAALGVGRERGEVRAVLALEAPFMADILGVEGGDFVFNPAPYPVAVLNVYSDSLWGRLDQLPQYARNSDYLRDADALTPEIHIIGATHLSLTDFGQTSPILTRWIDGREPGRPAVEILKQINQLGLAFFDCTLKGIGEWQMDGAALDCAEYAAAGGR